MNTTVTPSALSRFALLPVVALLAPAFLNAGEGCPGAAQGQETASVACFSEADCHGDYIMVFGSVGERFAYTIENAKGAPEIACAEGVDASGNACELPKGLVFNRDGFALEGVPQQAGFHEFVIRVTENGVAKDQVILIDIDDKRSIRLLDSYASYFFGGIR